MAASKNIMQLETEIVEVIQRTPPVKSVRLALPTTTSPEFLAGQFLQITLFQDGNLKKPLSISSAPSESSYLEVTKKLTDSEFSQAFAAAGVGYRVAVRFPMGRFKFTGEQQKIALLSGGIGITPFRSIAKQIVDLQLDPDVVLLYSNRTEQEIAFREDFEQMQSSSSKVKLVHTLTAPDDTWRGRRG